MTLNKWHEIELRRKGRQTELIIDKIFNITAVAKKKKDVLDIGKFFYFGGLERLTSK